MERCGVRRNPKDRWGLTPLDEASDSGVKEYLVSSGAERSSPEVEAKGLEIQVEFVTDDHFRMLYAAYYNDVRLMKSLLVSNGKNRMNSHDYLGRTALGLAASEGHIESVRYMVVHGANVLHKDSKGNMAIDDAIREKRTIVAQYLREVMN